MAKNSILEEFADELEEDFDCSNESHEHDMSSDILSDFVQASNQQMLIAMELTKLIVSKDTDSSMVEDKIFDIFRKASKVVGESSPLKTMLDNV